MPTIRDLVYPNRRLRKTLQAGLNSHRGPFDALFWPIMFLGIKIMRHNEALESLAIREYGSEAGILLRTMFEATVNLSWISKEPEIRLKRYCLDQFYYIS